MNKKLFSSPLRHKGTPQHNTKYGEGHDSSVHPDVEVEKKEYPWGVSKGSEGKILASTKKLTSGKEKVDPAVVKSVKKTTEGAKATVGLAAVAERLKKKKEQTFSYYIDARDKTTYDENLKDLARKKNRLDKLNISYTSDLNANELYNEQTKHERRIKGEIEEAVEVYDPSKKPTAISDEFFYEGTLVNPDLYDKHGNLKPPEVRNKKVLTKEEKGTLDYFLNKGKGKKYNEEEKNLYRSGEKSLTKAEYNTHKLRYLEEQNISDNRFSVQTKKFDPNDSSTYSDLDVSPGNAELMGGFLTPDVLGVSISGTEDVRAVAHKYQGWDWSPAPTGGGFYFNRSTGESSPMMDHAGAETDEYGNSNYFDTVNEYVMYNPFTQTSKKRLSQIARILNLPDENGKFNDSWIADLQDLNKVNISGGQEGNFIRGKNNVYMVDHPNYQFPKYIHFDEKYKDGYKLLESIREIREISPNFFEQWNSSQKTLGNLGNLRTLKTTSFDKVDTERKVSFDIEKFKIKKHYRSYGKPYAGFETGDVTVFEKKDNIEEDINYIEALDQIKYYTENPQDDIGQLSYYTTIKDIMEIQYEDNDRVRDYLGYKYLREKYNVVNADQVSSSLMEKDSTIPLISLSLT